MDFYFIFFFFSDHYFPNTTSTYTRNSDTKGGVQEAFGHVTMPAAVQCSVQPHNEDFAYGSSGKKLLLTRGVSAYTTTQVCTVC